MLPQTKKFASPLKDKSQVKMVDPADASFTKAIKPNASCKAMHQIGRPALSTYPRNRGAIPRIARACMVRVLPNAQLLATDKTEMVMTTLKILGSTLIPANWMAMTNGDALVFAPEA